jgi:hypothetical protein
MARIFEAYPNPQDPASAAPPPYSEADVGGLTADVSSDVVKATGTPVPQTPILWDSYDDDGEWSESPAGRASISRLRRYVIEILAFTFEMDLNLLSVALGQLPNTTSLLSTEERHDLHSLATLIRNMRPKVGQPSWLTVLDRDRALVIESVSKPVQILNLDGKFVFRLLDSYCDHRCDSVKRRRTLVSRQIPMLAKYQYVWFDGMLKLGRTVKSHVDLA